MGRLLWLRSAGTICFGLGTLIGYLVGGFTVANGLFNAYVMKVRLWAMRCCCPCLWLPMAPAKADGRVQFSVL